MRLYNTRFTSPSWIPHCARLHLCVIIISVFSPLWSACDDRGSSSTPAETQRDANARLTLRVILPSISDESMMLDPTRVALSQAAHDLEEVSARVTQGDPDAPEPDPEEDTGIAAEGRPT